MRKTLTLLLASTALTAAISLPAWSAMWNPATPEDRTIAAVLDDGEPALPLIRVSDDDDDDGDRRRPGHGRDDDDDDDEDDDNRGRAARNPAPAGTVAPPQNGLFGNGAPPQVKVN